MPSSKISVAALHGWTGHCTVLKPCYWEHIEHHQLLPEVDDPQVGLIGLDHSNLVTNCFGTHLRSVVEAHPGETLAKDDNRHHHDGEELVTQVLANC